MHYDPELKTEKACLKLQEFCDMQQLYRLLDNWAKSCGMAALIVDAEGSPLSENFGTTEFCRMIQSCDRGRTCCAEIWKANLGEVYECPFGFRDFSIPICLPDGQLLGRVLAGQALPVSKTEEQILQKTAGLGIDENTIRDALSRVRRKDEQEMQGAYSLLKETLRFFVEKSYSVWKTKNELKRAPARKDQVLSQITQIMYSYNLTVDIQTNSYTLITGTGMERTVAEYQKHSDYKMLWDFHEHIIHPAYLGRFRELTDFGSAGSRPWEDGHRGSFEYPVLYPGDTDYEWHEINVFLITQEDGTRAANILGRDVTQAHNAQVRSEKELRAAAAKNQILSELTRIAEDVLTAKTAGMNEHIAKPLDLNVLARILKKWL